MTGYEDSWRQRFKAVILGEGYSELFAERTLAEYLPQYMQDLTAFDKMLAEYEADQRS